MRQVDLEDYPGVRRSLPTAENKFHVGAPNGKHYWLTPPALYERLNKSQKLQHDVRDLILHEEPSMDYFKARDLANKIILLCTK